MALLFILGALNKSTNLAETASRMESVGLSPTVILLPMVILLEGIGGLLLASGTHFASYAAVGLAIFTLATNWYFHRFWQVSASLAPLEQSLFFKNIAITGALLFAAAVLMRDHASGIVGK